MVSVSQTVVGKAFQGSAIANCRNALVKCIKMQPIRKRDIPYIQNCKQHIQLKGFLNVLLLKEMC